MTKFDSGWSIFGSNSKQTLWETSEVKNSLEGSHEGDHSGKIIFFFFNISLGFQTVKNLPIMQETRVQSLGRELLIHVWLHWVFSCGIRDLCCVSGLFPCGTQSLVVVCNFSRAST